MGGRAASYRSFRPMMHNAMFRRTHRLGVALLDRDPDIQGLVPASDETCAGLVGPAQRVSRHSERLSFAEAGERVVLEYRYSTTHVRTSKSGEDRHDTAWLVVCGIGESQLPSCTEPIAVSCADADGAVSPVSWMHTAGTLTLESSANPDACERESLILGSYPLTFP